MIYSILLCGGQSSRLFPFNKILSDLQGTGESLIQQAYQRAAALSGANNAYVLTVPSMIPEIRKQIPVPKNRFLSDPVRRGTWPAILWAMAHLREAKGGAEAVLAVLTGDHVIPDQKAFQGLASRAVAMAKAQPGIVMLGVQPSTDALVWQGFGCFRAKSNGRVHAFEEKPSVEKARTFITEKGWRWNSGMFFFQISTAEAALKAYQPEQFRIYLKLIERVARRDHKGAERVYGEFPAQIPHPLAPNRMVDNTIDFAIMTPLVSQPHSSLRALAVSRPLRRWHDIGQWSALREICREDRRGNVVVGQVKLDNDVRSCIMAADRGCRMEVRGAEDCVVACSRDRALVIRISELARIKTLVAESNGPVVNAGVDALSISFQSGRLVVRPKP